MMTDITPDQVARHLHAIKQNEHRYPAPGSPSVEYIAGAIVTVDPGSSSAPSPPTNRNGVDFFGCGAPVSKDDLVDVIEVFAAARIERFFFRLHPTLQAREISEWLLESGFGPFDGARYVTLIRPMTRVEPPATPLRIQRASRAEVDAHAETIRRIYAPWRCSFFFESCEQPGFEHFLAYEGDTPISAAMLATHDDFAYLGWTATDPQHRGKGGQSALIAARLQRAAERRCRFACSETLLSLETSLRNLRRRGFEIAYERPVFVWE